MKYSFTPPDLSCLGLTASEPIYISIVGKTVRYFRGNLLELVLTYGDLERWWFSFVNSANGRQCDLYSEEPTLEAAIAALVTCGYAPAVAYMRSQKIDGLFSV